MTDKSANELFDDIQKELEPGRKVDNDSPQATALYDALLRNRRRFAGKSRWSEGNDADNLIVHAISQFALQPLTRENFPSYSKVEGFIWTAIRNKRKDGYKSRAAKADRNSICERDVASDFDLNEQVEGRYADPRRQILLELAADELFQSEEFGKLNLSILRWRANGLPINLICWAARLAPEYFSKLSGGKVLSEITYDECINAKPVPESTMRDRIEVICKLIKDAFSDNSRDVATVLEYFVRRGHESVEPTDILYRLYSEELRTKHDFKEGFNVEPSDLLSYESPNGFLVIPCKRYKEFAQRVLVDAYEKTPCCN